MRFRYRMLCTAIAASVGACGGAEGTKPTPVQPKAPFVSSVTVLPGVLQLETSETKTLTVEVRDQNGAVMVGKTPSWVSSNAAVATIDATSGLLRGVAVGSVTITASVEGKNGVAIANVTPIAVTSVTITAQGGTLFSGQSIALTAVLTDRNGAALTGRAVAWSSSNTRVATVDVAGNVSALSAGTTTVTAASEGVSASTPIVVSAPAGTVAPAITAVSPALLTPGITAVITGTNFSANAASNGVYVSGVAAVIQAASATQLTVTLPIGGLPCQSTQPVNVEVTTVSGTAVARQPMSVATQHTMAVGASFMVLANGGIGCNELPAAGTYVISVFNASRSVNQTAGFELRGSGGGPLADRLSPANAQRSVEIIGAPPARSSVVDPVVAEQAHEHLVRLEREMEIVRKLGSPRRYRRATRSMSSGTPSRSMIPVPTAVGALAQVNFHFNSCTLAESTPVTARVVYVGPYAIVLEDNAGVLAGKIDADLIALAKDFEDVSFPLLHNFGDPLAFDAETDANGRIIMLFTPKVNTAGANLLGFVSSCDFFPPSADPQVSASNMAEIFYARSVTDTSPANTSLNSRDGWKRQMPSTLIHESKHITSFAERFADPLPAINEQTWLEEATAQLASEMYGRALHGNGWRSNAAYFGTLDCEVRPTTGGCGGGVFVMGNHFGFLHEFLQSFENKSIISGTDDNDIYGSSWLFTRWLTDTYGGSNEGTFLRKIVKSVTTAGVDNVTAPSGKTWPELLSQFTLMLAADDLPGITAPYMQESWNLPAIFVGYNSDFPNSRVAVPLSMRHGTFGSSFQASVNVLRGGGAMLLKLSGTPTSSTQLLDLHAIGGPLPTNSNIGMAVLRIQ
ncbi:MAG: Ig-like domain-containing protein [bacterium]